MDVYSRRHSYSYGLYGYVYAYVYVRVRRAYIYRVYMYIQKIEYMRAIYIYVDLCHAQGKYIPQMFVPRPQIHTVHVRIWTQCDVHGAAAGPRMHSMCASDLSGRVVTCDTSKEFAECRHRNLKSCFDNPPRECIVVHAFELINFSLQ